MPACIKGDADKRHHHIHCVGPLTIIMKIIAAVLVLYCLTPGTYQYGKLKLLTLFILFAARTPITFTHYEIL